ncbi:MAG: hypothetical protein ACFFCH_08685 [Promethearchaeota archaeon]
MTILKRYCNVILAILLGVILGVIFSIVFGYWLWLPLMIGVCFLFTFFCKKTTDIPEKSSA